MCKKPGEPKKILLMLNLGNIMREKFKKVEVFRGRLTEKRIFAHKNACLKHLCTVVKPKSFQTGIGLAGSFTGCIAA